MVGPGRSCWRAGATTAFLALAALVASLSHVRSAEDLAALNKQVVQLYDSGKYAEAVPVARRAVSLAEKLHGAHHPQVAKALNNLAVLYKSQGRYAEAEPRYQRALAIREKTLGRDHPDVGLALNNLAELFRLQGRYAEAEPILKRALAIGEKALGRDHPDVATVVNNLAVLYYSQGRYGEAEPLYQRSLAITEKALGPDHPRVGGSLNNLAELFRAQGRYAEAEPLYKRSLAIRETALGREQPDVGESLNNLALLYWAQGRYAAAEPLLKRALAIFEQALGSDHPNAGTIRNNLAALYESQGRYGEAESLFKRALTIREQALGRDHPDVAQSLNNLANLYEFQGRYGEAEPLFKRSLAIREQALGRDHPDVGASLNNLANLYESQGRYAEAEPLFKRSLAIFEQALGRDHPDVATTLNNLAELYRTQGRYAEAEPLFKRALAIREQALGSEHPDVGESLNNLALLYYSQGRYAETEPLYQRALAITEKALGPDHPDVGAALNNLAGLYESQGRYAEAEPLYQRSLAITEKALGRDHPDVATTLNNLAALHQDQGRTEKALDLVRRLISQGTSMKHPALHILYAAEEGGLVPGSEGLAESFGVVQRASNSTTAAAVNQLSARFAAGKGELADLIRQEQDLARQVAALDKAFISQVSKPPKERSAAAEETMKSRLKVVTAERDKIRRILAKQFPDYAALAKPQPVAVEEIAELLGEDEALVVLDIGKTSYVWVLTRKEQMWRKLAVKAEDLGKQAAKLRASLDFETEKEFDAGRAYKIYQSTLGPVEEVIASKKRLSVVVNGALTSVPFSLLVTQDPAGKDLRDVNWLLLRHAVTVLPSVASMKILRSASGMGVAPKPLVGFADPVFNAKQARAGSPHATLKRGIKDFFQGQLANLLALAAAPPLPETRDELKAVANSLGVDAKDLKLGREASEKTVKQTALDQYRIVYFATHGLVAGETARIAKMKAEPALVLSVPRKATTLDDGLLTASEVAQLKLNADWVVLSACNTAAGTKPGAEALSGLARAFFYAGAHSLVVSHWAVESTSAADLMSRTFQAVADAPDISNAEALRRAMLAMLQDKSNPERAHPRFWAPFVIVGEPR